MKNKNVITKLAFNKNSVIELNDNMLTEINGGSTPVCVASIASSAGCAAVGGAIIGSLIAWMID